MLADNINQLYYSHTDLLVECYAIKTDTLVDWLTTRLSSRTV